MKQQDKNKALNHLRRLSKEIRIRESQIVISSIFNDTQKQDSLMEYKELKKYDIKELQMLSHVDYWNRSVNDYCLSKWFIFFADKMIPETKNAKHLSKIKLPNKSLLNHKYFDVTKLICGFVCLN